MQKKIFSLNCFLSEGITIILQAGAYFPLLIEILILN